MASSVTAYAKDNPKGGQALSKEKITVKDTAKKALKSELKGEDKLEKGSNKGGEAFLHEKIMSKDSVNGALELELKGIVKLAEGYKVYEIVNDERVPRTLADVMVGAENIRVFYDKNDEAKWIIMDGKTPVNNMRIGIMNNGFASLDHDKIDFKAADGFKLVDKKADVSFDIDKDTLVSIINDSGTMKVTKGGTDLYSTTNRLYAYPVNEEIKIEIMYSTVKPAT
jgi:hypothetical protein